MTKKFQSPITYRLREVPIKQIQVWKDAQARKLDRDGVRELAKSIKTEGLQNPPMVQKEGKNTYLLMSGQRRLAALKRLGAKKIPVLVLTRKTQHEIKDAKAASVVENLHRKNMDTKEMADACAFLAEQMGKSKAAQSLGLSMLTFKKYHGFAGVPDKLKDLVPKVISRDDATKLHQIIPNLSQAIKIAYRISDLDSPIKKRYLQILSHSPKSAHKTILKKARTAAIPKNISLKLSKRQAQGLNSQARNHDLAPNDLVGKVLSAWLKKKRFK